MSGGGRVVDIAVCLLQKTPQVAVVMLLPIRVVTFSKLGVFWVTDQFFSGSPTRSSCEAGGERFFVIVCACSCAGDSYSM